MAPIPLTRLTSTGAFHMPACSLQPVLRTRESDDAVTNQVTGPTPLMVHLIMAQIKLIVILICSHLERRVRSDRRSYE